MCGNVALEKQCVNKLCGDICHEYTRCPDRFLGANQADQVVKFGGGRESRVAVLSGQVNFRTWHPSNDHRVSSYKVMCNVVSGKK